MLDITEQPTAYYFDRAVYTFGRALENALDKAGQGGGKKSQAQQAMAKQMVLTRWLGGGGQYRDPVAAR